jgi:penicillin-binding protein-related factor A (putative recombinase)
VKEDVYYQRIKDPAQSFNPNNSLRFSLQNPYDCFMYSYPALFTLELKSTEGTSMTFYRDDFIEDDKKQTFMIKKNQILGLEESSNFKGIISGLVLNFRKTNHTYFWAIKDFIKGTKDLPKKSFNETDVINNNGYLFDQTLKRINYKYNIEKFISDMKLKGE